MAARPTFSPKGLMQASCTYSNYKKVLGKYTYVLVEVPSFIRQVPVDHIHRYDVFEPLEFADDECTVSKGAREGHVQVIPARLSLEPAATVS